MKVEDKTKEQLINELVGLRQRIAELEALETERKRMEEALQESEEKYRLLVEKATVTIIVAQDGMLKFSNPKAMEITGYSQEELASRPFTEFIHPDDLEVTGGYYLRFLQGEETPPIHAFRIIDKEGSIKWLESNAVLITWEGRPATLNFISDITKRKRAEEALERRASQLALVNKVARRAASILDLDQLLQKVVTAIQQSFNYYHVGLFLLDEIACELKLKATAGGFADIAPPDHRLALGEGMAGWTAQTGQPLLANDVSQEPRYVLGIPKEALTQAELCVPLKLAGKVIGVLDIQSSQLNAFDRMDLMAMETLADQLAVAVENAQLYQETARRLKETEALGKVAAALTRSLDLDQVLQSIVDAAARLIPASTNSVIHLVDETAGKLIPRATSAPGVKIQEKLEMAIGEGIAGLAVQEKRPINVPNVEKDPRFLPIDTFGPNKALLTAPLLMDGDCLGTLSLNSAQVGAFSADDEWLLTTLAAQATVAVKNARLHQKVRRQVEELTFLNRVGHAVTSSLDLEQVLKTVMEETARVLKTEAGSVSLLDKETSELIFEAVAGSRSEKVKGLRLPLEQGIAGWVAREGQPLLVPNVREDPRFYSGVDEASGFVTRSILAVPLQIKGKILGVIEAVNKTEGNFGQADVELLSSMTQSAAIAIENARLFEQAQREIAERKRAEEALRDSEQRYRHIFEHSPIGIGMASPDGKVVAANKAMQAITGYSAEELGKISLADTYENVEDRQALVEAVSQYGGVMDFPVRLKRKDGTPYDALLSISRINLGGKDFYHTIEQDITERKRAEEALRESEGKFRAIAENSKVGITIVQDLKFAYVNPYTCQFLGYTRDELIGKPSAFGIHPDSHPVADEKMAELLTGVTAVVLELRANTKSGEERWVEISTTLTDYKGEPTFISAFVDVTERKRAEEALRESEASYRELADSITDVFFGFDQDLRYTYWNKASEALTGIPAQEALGKSLLEVFPDTPETRRAEKVYRDVLRTQQPQTFVNETHLDGKRHFFEISAYPSQRGISVFVKDITERKRVEEAERNQRALAEALRDTAEALNSTLDFDEVLDRILVNAGRVVPHDAADILLVDPAGIVSIVRNRGYAERGLEGWASNRRFPLADFRSLRTIFQSGQPLAIPDTRSYVGWVDIPETRWILSYVCAPIRVRGQIVGFVGLSSTTPGFYTCAHTERLQAFADQAAVAIENARLYEQTQARSRYLETLQQINATLRSTLPLSQVLEMITQGAGQALHYVGSLILIPDTTGERLILGTAWGGRFLDAIVKLTGLEVASFGLPLAAEENPIVRAYLSGEFQAWSRAPERIVVGVEPAVSPKLALAIARAMGARGAVCLPLPVGDKVVGVLIVFPPREQLLDEERAMLLGLADQAGLAIENAQLLEAVTSHERDLQRLSAQLINAQEAERRRISQELHDEMGQALTAMSINLAAIEKELPSDLAPTTRERLAETSSLADRTLEQTRELALDLRPSMLDDLGLVPTLRWHVNRYAKRLNIEVEFEAIDLEERLPAEMETVIYRVVQEALTNVARHAQASRVRVRLDRKKSKVRALIEDDGQGFDVEEVATRGVPEHGAGLLGIRERVTSLGGRFRIRSRPGRGTRLSLEIPIT